MKGKGLIFIISGPAGSGKGTVASILRDTLPTVGLSVSATTRRPRPGEVDGKSYFFITRDEFEKLVAEGEIIEHTEYCSNLYGTLRREVVRITEEGRDVILEIEVEGAMQVKRLMGDDVITVMLTAPSAGELERRLRGRGTESDEVIRRRLARAKEELAYADRYDYVVFNETGKAEECAALVAGIISAEHVRSERRREFVDGFIRDLAAACDDREE